MPPAAASPRRSSWARSASSPSPRTAPSSSAARRAAAAHRPQWVWYGANGGVFNKAEHTWSFPSGAKIEFGHCETDGDVTRYQGREYSYLGIDEVTLLSEKVYLFLLSRLHSVAGLPIYVRCTGNLGGPGHDWVFARWRRRPRTTAGECA